MKTYTIEWDYILNQGECPPIHEGLDDDFKFTHIKADSVSEFKNILLTSLNGVGRMENIIQMYELNPLSYYKVELRNRENVYIGWIDIKEEI